MPNLHIMVIEDDAATLEYVYDLLTIHGYNVSRWMTSTLAVEQVTQRQPDLVVLHLSLHRTLDGWLLLLNLHVIPETEHIPVILYSANDTMLQTHSDEIRAMGSDVLTKPFVPEQLTAKIEALTT